MLRETLEREVGMSLEDYSKEIDRKYNFGPTKQATRTDLKDQYRKLSAIMNGDCLYTLENGMLCGGSDLMKEMLENTEDDLPQYYSYETLDKIREIYSYKDYYIDNIEITNRPLLHAITNNEDVIRSKNYNSVLVLNVADPYKIGGGFKVGTNGQEESLCRSSFLYKSLLSKSYTYKQRNKHNKGCYTNHQILSEKVPFIVNENGEFIHPFKIDVLTIFPVDKKEALENKVPEYLINAQLISRIACMLYTCYIEEKHNTNYRYNSIIIGMFGKNNSGFSPIVLASVYKAVLNYYSKALNAPKINIEFALEDKETYEVFRQVFNQ